MKKYILSLLLISSIILLSACSNDNSTTKTDIKDSEQKSVIVETDQPKIEGNATSGEIVPIIRNMDVSQKANGEWVGNFTILNFKMSPESLGNTNVNREGHAHIFIDEKYVGELLGDTYDFGKLEPGSHTIKIDLRSNDHSPLTYNNNILSSEVKIEVLDELTDKVIFQIPLQEEAIGAFIPELKVDIKQVDDLNIVHASVKNFTFTGNKIGTDYQLNEGVIQLYINEEPLSGKQTTEYYSLPKLKPDKYILKSQLLGSNLAPIYFEGKELSVTTEFEIK